MSDIPVVELHIGVQKSAQKMSSVPLITVNAAGKYTVHDSGASLLCSLERKIGEKENECVGCIYVFSTASNTFASTPFP